MVNNVNKRGFGFGDLHELCLSSSKSVDLSHVKKINCGKKSLNNKFITPIHCAAINPNVSILKKLLELSLEYNITDEETRKPIHYAAACESKAPLEYLLANGNDPRDKDRKGYTPLMIAA